MPGRCGWSDEVSLGANSDTVDGPVIPGVVYSQCVGGPVRGGGSTGARHDACH
jgi:hypothetical protein